MPKRNKTIIEEIKDDIGKYTKLEILGDTEGGKDLIAYLEENFISLIDELTGKYKIEDNLTPIIAEIDITLKLLRMLTRAEENKKLAINALRDEEKRELEL